MPPSARQRDVLKGFDDRYARFGEDLLGAVETEVLGVRGASGHTTPAQAAALVDLLALGPGSRLLDVGAGVGWPGLYLGQRCGCDVVLTDVPAAAMRHAAARVGAERRTSRCAFVRASGDRLPFRPRTFDAVVHTDVLC